jgi:predicted nucleotidyltransferase
MFIKILTDSFNIFAVILFGSYARGNAHELSDIDLAIFSDDFGKKPHEEMKKLFKLRRKVDTDIEPLPFSKKDYFEHDKAHFLTEVIATGKLIFKEGKIFI